MSHRVLSVLERAKMVCWFEETHSLAMVARRYRAEFGMDAPSLGQIKKIHQNFMQTGSVVGSTESRFVTATLASTEAAQLSQQAAMGPIERFA
ncbi:hypothetical protein M3Y98_00459200 [Aphelenchoides besseyi]|nr:hypothetical protein M3Y98_00459200 [Aphelenchoides besseyi]KAI6202762.1 hypothetical protein M3Y94_00477900 [Aphelenchoides besseyi]KAI6207469.1 hypothetical protein M3Y96_00012200 [Aphelenchoides besseyi]KAI6219908.1 hypothetical protein M3Y95_01077300 [Aphelenchoides besseyi]